MILARPGARSCCRSFLIHSRDYTCVVGVSLARGMRHLPTLFVLRDEYSYGGRANRCQVGRSARRRSRRRQHDRNRPTWKFIVRNDRLPHLNADSKARECHLHALGPPQNMSQTCAACAVIAAVSVIARCCSPGHELQASEHAFSLCSTGFGKCVPGIGRPLELLPFFKGYRGASISLDNVLGNVLGRRQDQFAADH